METAINKLDKIRNMALKGLKAQLMRSDRDFKTCWKISIQIAERIAKECDYAERN